MNTQPQPITIQFLSREHTIEPYDAEGLEFRLKIDSQLELRLYRLNRGWMARLDVACFDTFTQSGRQATAQEAIQEIEEVIAPLGIGSGPQTAKQAVTVAHDLLCRVVAGEFPATDTSYVLPSFEDECVLRAIRALELATDHNSQLVDEPTVEMSREMLAEALQGG